MLDESDSEEETIEDEDKILLRFGRVRAGAIGDVVKASEASEGKGIRSSCYGGRTYVVMVMYT